MLNKSRGTDIWRILKNTEMIDWWLFFSFHEILASIARAQNACGVPETHPFSVHIELYILLHHDQRERWGDKHICGLVVEKQPILASIYFSMRSFCDWWEWEIPSFDTPSKWHNKKKKSIRRKRGIRRSKRSPSANESDDGLKGAFFKCFHQH